MSKALIEFLMRPSSIKESENEAIMLCEVDSLRSELDACEEDITAYQWQKLQVARCLGSGTLRRGKNLANWEKAQSLIHTWVEEDYTPQSHEDLFRLHSEIEGRKTSYRTQNVYIGTYKFADPIEVPSLMNWFIRNFITKVSGHAIQQASKIRQSFLSIHPFENANGRCAQLLADYFLLRSGYLPQSFEDPVFGMVVGLPDQRDNFNPHIAFMHFIRSVQYSYELVLSGHMPATLCQYSPELHAKFADGRKNQET